MVLMGPMGLMIWGQPVLRLDVIDDFRVLVRNQVPVVSMRGNNAGLVDRATMIVLREQQNAKRVPTVFSDQQPEASSYVVPIISPICLIRPILDFLQNFQATWSRMDRCYLANARSSAC